MNCPDCGYPIPDGQRFCGRCGAKVILAATAETSESASFSQPDAACSYEAAPQPSVGGYAASGITPQQKKTLIVLGIIGAVLAVTGMILAIVFGAKSCQADSEAVNSSGGSVQGSMTSGNVHTITSPNGTVIFNDSRIDTSDASTQAQIEDYLQNKGGYEAMNNFNNDVERAAYGKISFVPMGNTFVFCYTFNNISEYEKSSMKTYLTSTMFVSTLAQDRQVTGITNLIEVFVMLNADGSVYYSRMVE